MKGASAHGCHGWSHDDLAPYFRRIERFTPSASRPAIDLLHRGNEGNWQTGYSWLIESVEKGVLHACEDVGIPHVPDISTPRGTLGVTPLQTFIDPKGQRSSLATAYLPPEVWKRPNLFVACHVPEHFEVHPRREIFLCGGAINTPQLLLLSGIGPEEELDKHRIPIVRASDAVGKNLKDHSATTTIMCKAKPGASLDYLGSTVKALPSIARYKLLGGGPLSSNAGEAAAFFRSWEHHPFPASSSE